MITAVFYWVSERLRDAALWPIHLVRDFPVRCSRLLQTLWFGTKALFFFPSSLVKAIKHKRFKLWFRTLIGDFLFGLHKLLTQLFDLVGGPELGQFFMHIITNTTPLTADEMAAMSSVLGPTTMRYDEVRVAEGGLFDLIFRVNGNLAFTTWQTVNFPRNGRHTRQNLPIMIHELAHVYQYEKVGSRYLGEAIYMLIKTKRDCYNYGKAQGLKDAHKAKKQFAQFNREQQAQIIQDYFVSLQQNIENYPYLPFIQQAQSGKL